MFIKCDTIKIRTNYKYLQETKKPFNIKYNSKGKEHGIEFNSKHYPDMPFNLYIATNNNHQTLEIEFSSKILKERYHELINKDTIQQCLQNINQLNICTLDIDSILHNSCIIRADITKDIDLQLTDEILQALNNNVGNYRRFKWQHYENKGITFTKNTIWEKEEIKIYNKYKELLNHSYKFLNTLPNKQQIINHFYRKTRFEITLRGEKQIKERLGVNTDIHSFFNALDTAVRDQYQRVFNLTALELDTTTCHNHDQWAMTQILDKFNGDLQQIEQNLRANNILTSYNGITTRMKKYQALKAHINHKENKIIKEICNLL